MTAYKSAGENDVSVASKADSQAFIVATCVSSVLCAAFVYPLPPSPTFFDALGRITCLYGIGGGVLALLSPPQSRSFSNIGFGSLIVTFVASMVGILLEKLLGLIGF